MKTEFTNPRTGWSAECQDCPFTIGLDYGQKIYPRAEFDDPDTGREEAQLWAAEHRVEHPEHQPKVDAFARWTLEVTDYAPDLLEAIFGPVGVPADAEHQGGEQ